MAERSVVIGSGMAGLSAAAVLGHFGHRVTVAEAAPVSAPLLRGFRRHGLSCDVGFHYSGGLNPEGLLSRSFAGLGIGGLETRPLAADGFDRLLWPQRGIDLRLPVGMQRAGAIVAESFPASRSAVRAYFAAVEEVLAETPYLNPECSPERWPVSRHDRVSLAEFLRSHGAREDLVQLLGRYGEMLFGMGAEETPLSTHAVVLGSYLVSAHTVVGGGAALAEALLARIEAHGSEVLLGRAVRRVLCDESRVRGVELADGERVEAEHVVFTAHPALLPQLLADHAVGASYERRLQRAENTPGMVVAFFDAAPPFSHNSYLFFDAEPGAENSCRHLGLMAGSPHPPGRRGALCVIRDDGGVDWNSLRDTGSRKTATAYEVAKNRLLDEALQAARGAFSRPPLEAEVVEVSTPLSFARWTGSRGGAAYGLKRPVGGRRLNALTPIAGFYLAGQSVLCPGIMGAHASALVAAGHIVGHQKQWREILPC